MAGCTGISVSVGLEAPVGTAGGRSRLLMVDDEQRILQLFAPLLEDAGFYVRTASTPDEALRLVREDSFHIAFVDQFLGTVKGLDLLDDLSAASPGLHFVIMTACASPDLAVEAMKRGASDFLSKPFFIGDFIRSIEYVQKKIALSRKAWKEI